ncbi:aquaporin-like protein [Trypanosoma rangeli]|uniref:Aquaporin-like protein n=1 Tax=Trypanosoma rangeli TaxID=5698 RepID=A0A422N886_TRYRA|nr:aquaporin-like protein [Trypanosoma rangeli]RNF01661.1 aquaporin-like protein [Trypanosoma rangeli]|eukprot:RNF01661.1 aquaporin-like protein [Trypanosoma rangeli]
MSEMPKYDASAPGEQQQRASSSDAPDKNKYADPLHVEYNETEIVRTSSTTHVAAPAFLQAQQQQPREACTAEDTNVTHTPEAGLQVSSGIERGSCRESMKPQYSTDFLSANDSSTEFDNNKKSITVEVTSDGVTRMMEFEPRELARLYAQQQAALRSVCGEFDILYVPDWVRLHPLLGSYVAEAFGTFACVLTLSLVSVRNQSIFDESKDTNVTALPIGFMFMCMVFTFGYISGGHFNPAVTLAVFLVQKLDFVRAVGYMICQTGAATGAGLVAMAIQGSTDIFVPYVNRAYVSSGIFSELIFTFAIATVVLNVAYSRQSGNFFYGFAIGMTVAAGSAAVGRISGGAFNPAAATGLQLALCLTGNCEPLSSFWVYWMAPLVGSVIAALLYSQISQPEDTRVLTDAAVLSEDPLANKASQVS